VLFCDLAGFTARADQADPERAVRCALAVLEAAEELELPVRVGVVLEQGHALLGAGRCAARLGGAAAAARGPLGQARAIFDRLGATALLAETDRLLAELAT
jgi:hypothetical protein